ncbi:MAG: energy transducer TonB [Flammeovirgaceae bacterium]|jgi:TonB family protein|nr:energy transducer TonB [Flammeovirgaceae bacterium]
MRIALFIVFFFAATFGFSQHVYVGRVCDKETKQPLRNVLIRLDSSVTYTNAAGFFQVVADTTKVLVAEMEGYEKVLYPLSDVDRFLFYIRRLESESDHLMAKSFYTFFGENIKYPITARRAGNQGTVLVYFETDTLGKVTNTKITARVSGGCSEEVVRVLRKAPEVWYQIKKNNKFVIPVVFKLGDSISPIENIDKTTLVGVVLLPEIVVAAYTR